MLWPNYIMFCQFRKRLCLKLWLFISFWMRMYNIIFSCVYVKGKNDGNAFHTKVFRRCGSYRRVDLRKRNLPLFGRGYVPGSTLMKPVCCFPFACTTEKVCSINYHLGLLCWNEMLWYCSVQAEFLHTAEYSGRISTHSSHTPEQFCRWANILILKDFLQWLISAVTTVVLLHTHGVLVSQLVLIVVIRRHDYIASIWVWQACMLNSMS